MSLFRNWLHYGNICAALKLRKQNTCADWGYVAPAFHCFPRSRSEQEVALSIAAISDCMFFSLLATLTCFLFSLAPGHANTTNRFHFNFFPHCIPPRLVSSVVSSSWSSFGCKAYWKNAACCFVLHGTCVVFHFFLFCTMFSAAILFHFPFHYCQKSVFVRTVFLFISRPSHSLSFSLHSLCYSLMEPFSLIP